MDKHDRLFVDLMLVKMFLGIAPTGEESTRLSAVLKKELQEKGREGRDAALSRLRQLL